MAAVIQEQIKSLIELQKYDSQIHKLQTELAEFPALKKNLEGDFERKKASFKAAEEAVKARQLDQKKKEGDLAAAEEKIKKLQGQLYALKTNKEYQAMDMEIKGLKADNSIIEEDILRLFDAVEDAKKTALREKELLGGEEKKFSAEMDTIKKREAELQSALKDLDAKRGQYLPNVEKRLFSQYDRILKGRDGLALVPVKNNSCGGCHMEIPAQMVNEIHMMDKIMICESCARILYWPS